MPGFGSGRPSGAPGHAGTVWANGNVVMGRVQRPSDVLPGWAVKGLSAAAWEVIVVMGRTLKLRRGPEDDDATLVVFAGRASDPVPRYYVASANEREFTRAQASPLDNAALELLQSLAKSRPGVVAGTPGAGAQTPGLVLSESAILRRLKVAHFDRRSVSIKDAKTVATAVDACVLRHREATLAELGADTARDGDAYIVPVLGPLLSLLPGEIGRMFRSGNGSDTDGPTSEYRITQLPDGRFRVPLRVMTAGCIHALSTVLVPEMQRILDAGVGAETGWRQRPIKAIMSGAGEVPEHFWTWFATVPPDGLKLPLRQTLAMVRPPALAPRKRLTPPRWQTERPPSGTPPEARPQTCTGLSRCGPKSLTRPHSFGLDSSPRLIRRGSGARCRGRQKRPWIGLIFQPPRRPRRLKDKRTNRQREPGSGRCHPCSRRQISRPFYETERRRCSQDGTVYNLQHARH